MSVVDIHDDDAGWTIRGDIEDRFTSAANGDSFSGDYLGWQPIVTYDSGPVGGEGPNGSVPLYDQTVIAGPPILAGHRLLDTGGGPHRRTDAGTSAVTRRASGSPCSMPG